MKSDNRAIKRFQLIQVEGIIDKDDLQSLKSIKIFAKSFGSGKHQRAGSSIETHCGEQSRNSIKVITMQVSDKHSCQSALAQPSSCDLHLSAFSTIKHEPFGFADDRQSADVSFKRRLAGACS